MKSVCSLNSEYLTETVSWHCHVSGEMIQKYFSQCWHFIWHLPLPIKFPQPKDRTRLRKVWVFEWIFPLLCCTEVFWNGLFDFRQVQIITWYQSNSLISKFVLRVAKILVQFRHYESDPKKTNIPLLSWMILFHILVEKFWQSISPPLNSRCSSPGPIGQTVLYLWVPTFAWSDILISPCCLGLIQCYKH